MPVYNEIMTIAAILERVEKALPGVTKEIVIVDDGSRDDTRAWLTQKFPSMVDEHTLAGGEAPPHARSDECFIRSIFHSIN